MSASATVSGDQCVSQEHDFRPANLFWHVAMEAVHYVALGGPVYLSGMLTVSHNNVASAPVGVFGISYCYVSQMCFPHTKCLGYYQERK